MKIRSFLAFDISEKMRTELASVISCLSEKANGLKWVEPSRMHCTLRFFGEVEEELLMGKISSVIERELLHQAPIHLMGHGIGAFPNWRYPKVIWAGLAGETEAMTQLQARLERAFEEFSFKKDKREFRLHLTLGRIKSRFGGRGELVNLVEKLAERKFGEIEIGNLTLYKSVLTREGPTYTALRRFTLGEKRR